MLCIGGFDVASAFARRMGFGALASVHLSDGLGVRAGACGHSDVGEGAGHGDPPGDGDRVDVCRVDATLEVEHFYLGDYVRDECDEERSEFADFEGEGCDSSRVGSANRHKHARKDMDPEDFCDGGLDSRLEELRSAMEARCTDLERQVEEIARDAEERFVAVAKVHDCLNERGAMQVNQALGRAFICASAADLNIRELRRHDLYVRV